MSMTKKDYEMVAALVCRRLDASWNTDPAAAVAIEGFALEMADAFEDDNPNFNRAKFLGACRIEVAA